MYEAYNAPVSEMLLRHIDAGHAALARGEWEEAKRAFDAALAAEETGEALEGLGLAAWWLDLADVVFDARERAYRIYHEQNNRTAAARVAVWLAWDTSAFRGEHAIATGWLQRARRLLDDQPPAPEHAWLALRVRRVGAASRRKSRRGGRACGKGHQHRRRDRVI